MAVPPQVPPGSVQAPPPLQASPRGAELYLEAAAALLLAGRGPDCWALCDEVLSATLDLLPQRLTLGDPSEDQDQDRDRDRDRDRDQDRDQDPLDVVLWAGTAHLLQAHCQAALEDWKQAVTCYTRWAPWGALWGLAEGSWGSWGVLRGPWGYKGS